MPVGRCSSVSLVWLLTGRLDVPRPSQVVAGRVARTVYACYGYLWRPLSQRSPLRSDASLFSRLVILAACVHVCCCGVITQERRKFGSLGFNIRYEFNASDLECSSSTLNMFLSSQDATPWEALEYVIGQVNYGGRYAPCCLAADQSFSALTCCCCVGGVGLGCVHVPLASCVCVSAERLLVCGVPCVSVLQRD